MKINKFLFCSKNINAIKEQICKSCKLKQLENPFICGICTTGTKAYDYIKQKDYFTLFNIKNEYLIDASKLDNQYKDLQKMVHPDKYSNEGKVIFIFILYRILFLRRRTVHHISAMLIIF